MKSHLEVLTLAMPSAAAIGAVLFVAACGVQEPAGDVVYAVDDLPDHVRVPIGEDVVDAAEAEELRADLELRRTDDRRADLMLRILDAWEQGAAEVLFTPEELEQLGGEGVATAFIDQHERDAAGIEGERIVVEDEDPMLRTGQCKYRVLDSCGGWTSGCPSLDKIEYEPAHQTGCGQDHGDWQVCYRTFDLSLAGSSSGLGAALGFVCGRESIDKTYCWET